GRPGLAAAADGVPATADGAGDAAPGRDPARPLHLPDSGPLLRAALEAADATLVLVSGSSAAGPADHLRPALAALGASLLVDGVACRPGHPQTLARLPDGRLVVGLPGNPFAALVAFLTLAVPVLAGLRGAPLAVLAPVDAPAIAAHDGYTRLVPVLLRAGRAEPVGHGGAAMLRGAAVADALAVVAPAGARGPVRALPLAAGATWDG
ncbi:MAG: molybdopterin-binding protein, partial [Pseudonocardia sp.]